MSVKERRIVITRPQHQAGLLAKAIKGLDLTPVAVPALGIEFLDYNPLIEGLISCYSSYHAWIFSSPNSVLGLKSLIKGKEDFLNNYPDRPRYVAMGEATAGVLCSAGLPMDFYPECRACYNSEAVLNLPILKDVHHRSIALFMGQSGRKKLPATLYSRGAFLDQVKVYERYCPQDLGENLGAAFKKPVDMVIVTSEQALKYIVAKMPAGGLKRLYQTPLLVGSERIGRSICCYRFSCVKMASNPTDGAILKALEEFYCE